jgi:hypothetical protein
VSRKGRTAAPAIFAAKLKTWGRCAPLSRHKAAPTSIYRLPPGGSAAQQRTRLYSRAFHRIRTSSQPMEIQPILNTIKDLTERSQSIRGYL